MGDRLSKNQDYVKHFVTCQESRVVIQFREWLRFARVCSKLKKLSWSIQTSNINHIDTVTYVINEYIPTFFFFYTNNIEKRRVRL